MHKSLIIITVFVAFVSLVTSCQSKSTPPSTQDSLGEKLQILVEKTVDKNEMVKSAALHVDAPTLELRWEGAAGVADPSTGELMTPAHPVRIASNTKTYIAAAILRLSEEGRLKLDESIAEYLPAEYAEKLHGDGYRPKDMTIRHLLTHTSGLYDHSDSDNYVQEILADPMRRWTRAEQFEAAIEWGEPLAAPGEIYSYCDTGYILLGAIIEQSTAQPMAAAVRELIDYGHLGLDSTWWETLEPRPQGVPNRAHQFLGDLDTGTFDPSYDLYGGGGLAATVGDMARFMRALFTGGVYAKPETAEIMLTTIEGLKPGTDESQMPPGVYRMGVWVVEVEGFTTYRHIGFFGTAATYVPDLDLSIAATVNQNADKDALVELVHQALVVVRDAD